MKRWKNTGKHLEPLAVVLFLLLVWEALVRWYSLPVWLLPGPWQIGKTVIRVFPVLWEHAKITVLESIVGFGLAVMLGVLTAVVMDEVSFLKRALYPILIASQTVPIVSVAPLFILWFGYGILPKVMVVILVCFFPVALSLMAGLAGVDPDYIELFRSMKARKKDVLLMVKLPLAMPSFFSGLRIAATYAVMGAVIGEWLGAKSGLGVYMTVSQHSFQVDRVFAAILAITVLSMGLVWLIHLVERLALPWMYLTPSDWEGWEG